MIFGMATDAGNVGRQPYKRRKQAKAAKVLRSQKVEGVYQGARLPMFANLPLQPRTRVRPKALGASRRHVESRRRFLHCHTDKVTELNQLGGGFVLHRQLFKRVIDGN